MNVARIRSTWSFLFWTSLLWVSLTARTLAQGITTGSIAGTVEDRSEAVVSGSTLTAVQAGTNTTFKAVTNATGQFHIPGLPVGSYSVTVEARGFRPLRVQNVLVSTASETQLGVLTVAIGTTEAVIVEGATALLQADAVQVSQVFDHQKTANLPIGNEFDIVALLAPGVAPSGGNTFTNNNGAEFSTNGLRDRNNNFQLDGQANNDTNIGGPNILFGNADALAEVQIITVDSAAYGRNSGAVVNYVTKSGSNTFHGTGYEFYNGSWADSLANQDKSPLLGYCPSGQSEGCLVPTVPRYVDNRWGATIGGPIWREKLWFFGAGNFEHARTGANPYSSAPFVTPTPNGIAQLQSAFPNNPSVGALSAIGPASVHLGTLTFGSPQLINVLGQPIEFATARRTVASPFYNYEGMGRIDYQVSARDRIFGRYLYQNALTHNANYSGPAGGVIGTLVDVGGVSQYVGVDWSHIFNNHVLNQIRYSYSHTTLDFQGGGFPNCTSANILSGCPIQVVFNDGQDLAIGQQNASWPQGRIIQSHQFENNATWQVQRHIFHFGGEFSRFPETDSGLPYTNGSLVFASFGDYINSNPVLTQYADGRAIYDLAYNAGALYFQDDCRIRTDLTFSLGLRYEVQSQPINGLHNQTVLRESDPATALWDTTLPLNLRTVQSLPIVWHNLSPVVGFAWMPYAHGQNSTVIRGGFRIGYDVTFNNPFSNIAQATPSVNFANLGTCNNCVPTDGLGSSFRAIVDPLVPRGVNPGFREEYNTDPRLHNPYTEQWTFGIQQALNNYMVGEARYLGNHGVSLYQFRNGNPALNPLIDDGFSNVIPAGYTPCSSPNTPGATAGFANCNLSSVGTLGNTASSNYNALQVRFSIEHWHGVTAGFSYTWSKTIDTVSEIYPTLAGGNTTNYAQSPFDLSQAERAVSGLDYPQLASIYAIFEVPFFGSRGGLKERILGGWQINPVWRFVSGQPYTVLEGAHSDHADFSVPFDTTLCDPEQSSGSTTCRPILANRKAPIDTVGLCLNPSASDCGLVNYYTTPQFTNNPASTPIPVNRENVHWIVNDLTAAQFYGTPFAGAGRNLQRGDSINNANLAVLKTFRVNDRLSIETRGVAYNVMNRQYRGTPGVNIDYGSFADVQGAFGNTYFNSSGDNQTNSVFSGIDRRRIEVGGKLIF